MLDSTFIDNHDGYFYAMDPAFASEHVSHLSQWHEGEDPDWFLFVPDILSYSDYSGGTVHQANVKAFLSQFESECPVELHGPYGYHAVGLRAHHLANPEIIEVFRSLEQYPVLDDDLWSEIENEAENEAWESWVRSEFVSWLESQYECDLDIPGDVLWEIFHLACDESNTYWEHETCGATIELGRIIQYAVVPDEYLPATLAIECATDVARGYLSGRPFEVWVWEIPCVDHYSTPYSGEYIAFEDGSVATLPQTTQNPDQLEIDTDTVEELYLCCYTLAYEYGIHHWSDITRGCLVESDLIPVAKSAWGEATELLESQNIFVCDSVLIVFCTINQTTGECLDLEVIDAVTR